MLIHRKWCQNMQQRNCLKGRKWLAAGISGVLPNFRIYFFCESFWPNTAPPRLEMDGYEIGQFDDAEEDT